MWIWLWILVWILHELSSSFDPFHEAHCATERGEAKGDRSLFFCFGHLLITILSLCWRFWSLFCLSPFACPLCGRVRSLELTWNISRKGFCRNPRGIFPTEFPGEFCGGFFRGIFSWKEEESIQTPTAKFKSEFGSFAAKIHTVRICPWEHSSWHLRWNSHWHSYLHEENSCRIRFARWSHNKIKRPKGLPRALAATLGDYHPGRKLYICVFPNKYPQIPWQLIPS